MFKILSSQAEIKVLDASTNQGKTFTIANATFEVSSRYFLASQTEGDVGIAMAPLDQIVFPEFDINNPNSLLVALGLDDQANIKEGHAADYGRYQMFLEHAGDDYLVFLLRAKASTPIVEIEKLVISVLSIGTSGMITDTVDNILFRLSKGDVFDYAFDLEADFVKLGNSDIYYSRPNITGLPVIGSVPAIVEVTTPGTNLLAQYGRASSKIEYTKPIQLPSDGSVLYAITATSQDDDVYASVAINFFQNDVP